jgi:hypothetical protein
VESPGGDPKALVVRAVALRDAAAVEARRAGDPNLAYDDVWCVFDVDTHPRLTAARAAATEAGIHLAISNPCFELWLLLHFTPHAAHATPAGARRLIRNHLPEYDKHLRFEDLADGYDDAVKRAEALDRHHASLGQEGGNPSTGVHRLTERIREFGKTARLV